MMILRSEEEIGLMIQRKQQLFQGELLTHLVTK